MPRFSQTVLSDDQIQIAPEALWEVLVDPDLLAELTPLVDRITQLEDRWTWRLVTVNALGMRAAPEFTTLIRLHDGTRIDFEPDPSAEERASAEGFLTVGPDGDGGARIAIDVTATVELPLPTVMGRPVRRVMFQTMKAGGTRFARNLLAHLGNPPHRGLDVRAVDREGPGR